MKNPAPSAHPIADLLAHRWSPRAFVDRPVDAAALRQLFEAARWAASSFNDQPWYYLVAARQNPEEFQKMLACLIDANQAWAKAAPVLAISVARTKLAHNGAPNGWARHDVGAASASLAIQATELGLAVHQMAGFDPNRARETYHIPEDYEPVAAMAIGYPGEPDALPDALRQRELAERKRKPMTDFVFSGDWGSVAPFVKPGAH
jgi:nitroreductase